MNLAPRHTPTVRNQIRLLVAIVLSLFANVRSSFADKPNILFVIADDWGLHAGAYGTTWVKTPAFDRVANEGLLFKNAYTPMAKCAPSRAILLTGRHLWQNEEAGNHMAMFPAKLKSWPEVLTENGWHMGITGKGWGPGIAKDANGNQRAITGKGYNARKAKPPTGEMVNNDYTANFVDFLEDSPKGKSWCFWCGMNEPHRAYEFQSGVKLGGKKLSDIDRVPSYLPDNETVRHDMLDYAFEVEYVDKHLAQILAELERRGELDNTLIIVTSDHGMPFPRVKGYAYHDSNHIPLAIRWPIGIKSAGRSIEDFVSFTELAPTVLDAAQIQQSDTGMMPITGKSWFDIFESDKAGQVTPYRDHVLIGKERTDVGRPNDQGYPIRGIVTATHLFLKNYEPSRWPAGNPETGYLDTDASPTKTDILEQGRRSRDNTYWRMCFGLRPAQELFDLTKDRDCAQNLATVQSQSNRVAELEARMEKELLEQGDPRMKGDGKIFDAYVPTAGAGFYEKYMRGEKVNAGWVNKADFESGPIKP